VFELAKRLLSHISELMNQPQLGNVHRNNHARVMIQENPAVYSNVDFSTQVADSSTL
jgi:hypothetical protein